MKSFAIHAALALALTLGACERRPAEEPGRAASPSPKAPRPITPSAPVRPLTFKQSDPAADVGLILAAEIGQYPVLHAMLYDREVAQLKAFAARAEADRKQNDGTFPWRPYDGQREWTLAAATPSLVSLRGSWFDYTGGAHPNHGSTGLLWDVKAETEIKPSALFRPGADMKVLDKAICDAVAVAKSHREGASPLDSVFGCPKWSDTELALAPSTEAGKIGGLIVLIDPYVVGSYAEGDYEVTIPLSAFRALLAPAYGGIFGGSPKSPGNPDGSPTTRI